LKRGQAAAHAGFILTGIVNTLLGPILPIVSVRWSLTDAQAGRLFAAQFLGAIIGTLFSSRAMAVIGVRRCFMLGLALMAVGVTATGFAGPGLGALAVVCYGLGLGFCVPSGNLWIAQADPRRSAAALTLLNATWCIGAASCAPLILFATERFGFSTTLSAVGVLLAVTAAIGAAIGGRGRPVTAAANQDSTAGDSDAPGGSSTARGDARLKPGATHPTGPDAASGASPAGLVRAGVAPAQPVSPAPVAPLPRIPASAHVLFIALIASFLFIYVGAENAIGGWAATYAKRLAILSAAKIGFAQSIFYGALLVGRLIATAALRRISALRLVFAGLLIGAAGALLFSISPGMPQVLGGICIAGIGLAPMFPVVVSIYSDELGAAAVRNAALVFAVANLGGVVAPWLIGEVSTRLGDLRYGMLVPLGCIAAMLVIANRLSALLRRRNQG